MSGWCPSSPAVLDGMAVVCAAAVLHCSVVRPVPCLSQCSTDRYCCRVMRRLLPGVWCVVRVSLSEVFAWWGILHLFPPLRGGGWGHCVWRGGMTRWGGVADEGRAARW